MILFYLIMGAMTFLAMGVLAYPFWRQLWLAIILLPIVALGLYWYLGASEQLTAYEIAQARANYVQAEIEKLGSIENIIATLKQKVMAHPDGQGWYLLGKLYLKTQQFEAAKQAFSKAKELGFTDEN